MSDQPTNIVAALARVTAELGGIEKLSPEERRRRGLGGGDERGVSYAYRGVDQIAAAAGPLFGKYGVVVVPDVVTQTVEQLTINSKPWTDTAVEVVWTLYGPGGLEDRITSRTRGLGRDNSDKGPNKALTQSYKNLLLRLLCIGDPSDDVDGHTHEADAHQPVIDNSARASELQDRIALLPAEAQNKILAWFGVSVDQWHELADEHLNNLADVIARAEKVEASTEPSGSQGGEGDTNPPTDPPAPPAAPAGVDDTTTPGGAAAKPSAAERAAARGRKDKPALGAVRNNDAPTEGEVVEQLQDAFPGAEVAS